MAAPRFGFARSPARRRSRSNAAKNRGHTLTYTNVVRRWVKLGVWTGKAKTFSVPVANLADAEFSIQDIDRVAVVVQSGVAAKPGLMLGAAVANLH